MGWRVRGKNSNYNNNNNSSSHCLHHVLLLHHHRYLRSHLCLDRIRNNQHSKEEQERQMKNSNSSNSNCITLNSYSLIAVLKAHSLIHLSKGHSDYLWIITNNNSNSNSNSSKCSKRIIGLSNRFTVNRILNNHSELLTLVCPSSSNVNSLHSIRYLHLWIPLDLIRI